MLREMLKSKIHRATVTEADLNYEGSISIGSVLREAADLCVGEKVHVVNINNGARFVTYVLDGKPGEICLNGAAARLGHVGDKVIIMAYGHFNDEEVKEYHPNVVHVDDNNAVVNMG